MQKKSFFLSIFLIFLPLTQMFAQTAPLNAPVGTELSLALEKNLKKNGFLTVKQELAVTGNDDFPFNVLVSFPPSNPSPSATNLIIAFTQEDAFSHFEKIIEFLNNIKKTEKECSVEILFSAEDMGLSTFGPRFQSKMGKTQDEVNLTGTKVFSRNIDDSSSHVVLPLRFSDEEIQKSVAYPGSSGDSPPAFLVKMIFEAFDDCGEKILIHGSSLSLYRLKILSGEKRMQAFMEEGIPAISVLLSDEEKLSCIEKFIENFKSVETNNWDRHYSFFLNGQVFLPERFFVLFFLVVLAITLFVLFAFSFVGHDRHASRLEFFKTVYIFPVTVLVSFLALVLAQGICILFFKNASPAIIWTIKLALAVIFVTIVFVFQERFFGTVRANVYGYITTLATLLNIIVFSAIDLSFLFVFLTVYLITYFARTAKSPISLIIYFFLMLLPFFPYARNLLFLSSEESLKNVVICSGINNFVFALAIFPHLMIYLQIFHSLKILRPELVLKKRQIVVRGSILTLGVLGVIILTITAFFLVSKSNLFRDEDGEFTLFDFTQWEEDESMGLFEKEREFLNVVLREQQTIALNNQILMISTEKPALKVEVKVFGSERSPVYNANYDFELNEKEKSAVFFIPDNPPQNFSISFISSESFFVVVKAYFSATPSPDIYVETFRSDGR